jgi:hypothetical protein
MTLSKVTVVDLEAITKACIRASQPREVSHGLDNAP